MLRRIKTAFILASAFGYGFLGGGPSLWALGVSPPDPLMACLQMGCTCRLHPGKGGACCCVANRALLKKHPDLAGDPKFWRALGLDPPSPRGTCLMHTDSCPMDGGGGSGVGPVSQQHHWPVQISFSAHPDESRVACLGSLSARSRDRESPVPGPD